MPLLSEDSKILGVLADVTVKTEGLLPGQTPLRFGYHIFKDTIQGVPIDWNAHSLAPKDRQKFYFVEQSKVHLVIRKQYRNYFLTPRFYGLTENSTIEDVVNKFDQDNPKNKIKLLIDQGIHLSQTISSVREEYA